MQGLRESGTFTSLIASAQTSSLPEPEVLSSVNDANISSKAIEGSDTLSKKTEMTGRKVLEASEVVLLAVPPLPPPTMDDDI